jgi:molybdopterin converting factor small subunit
MFSRLFGKEGWDMVTATKGSILEIHDLMPEPGDEWQRMLSFVTLDGDDKQAMAQSAETLLRRAPELVVNTYDYLRSVPETAAILGWEDGVDEEHLEERRRFFTIWLTRTLGLDTGDEFAHYLYRAGKFHAGHGPRQIHTPPAYVTASIGLVLASFSNYMSEAGLPAEVIARAMAGWNKYLMVQLHLMLLGYQSAMAWDRGSQTINVSLFGRLRPMVGQRDISLRVGPEATMADVLKKFFDYFAQLRVETLEQTWQSEDEVESLWMEVHPVYVPRPGWRILLNGRNVEYNGGFGLGVNDRDTVSIFPPGR